MAQKWDLETHAKSNEVKTKKKKKKGCSVIVLTMMIIFVASIGALFGGVFGLIETSGDINLDEYLVNDNVSTIFYDKDGKKIGTIHSGENRLLVSLNDIPNHFQKAFISIEDERFYEHKGIDYRRTAGAVFDYIKTMGEGSYGGSTITQQLVKNITSDKERSVVRKMREWWRAIMLEKELSKDQILELYMNTVYFGNGAYGVQTAANVYFDKEVSELTLAESALLAGVTNRPGYYDPFKNLDNAIERQKVILEKMKELGYIDTDTYNEALAEEIVIKKGSINNTGTQSYFVDMVIDDLIKDLMEEKNITQAVASQMVYSGGFSVYTTMDSKIQDKIDKVYIDKEKETFKSYAGDAVQPESAMVIIDYKKGYIRGIAGGRGENKDNRGFNRATQAYRQPGSTIKPLAVYGPAIQDGLITDTSTVSDSPLTVKLSGGETWSPTNWYSGYKGRVSIRYAIEQSMNIPAVRVLKMIGLNRSYQALLDVGITSLQITDKNYAPLSLGGLTSGVSVREWAAAYGMIANDGTYVKPVSYTKVVDSKGQTILQKKTSKKSVMDEDKAYMLKDILKTVMTNGTGTPARLSNMTAGGKTGSTTDDKDKWFVGFTPYYVCAVWVGYDQPKEITKDTNLSKRIWKGVMEDVHKGLSDTGFIAPNGIKKAAVCKKTGLLATSTCTSKEYKWVPGNLEYCEGHVVARKPVEETPVEVVPTE